MAEVFILVDAEVSDGSASAELARGVTALQQAIAARSDHTVQVVSPATLTARSLPADATLCPLTLSVPEHLDFPERAIFAACRNLAALRRQVLPLGCAVGAGDFWLPIALTARGALYAEAIAAAEQGAYLQPLHLADRWRQPLYHLAQRLLTLLTAPPAVYLMQFGFQNGAVCFDRLLPFPDLPATASIGVQTPDLYECHWRCITHQPIVDLAIAAPAKYRVYDPAAQS